MKSAKPAPQKKDNSSVAASERKGGDRQTDKDRKKDVPHPRMQFDDENRVEKAKKRSVVKQAEARNRVELFRHLPQYEHGARLTDLESKFFQLGPVHPAVYKVFLMCYILLLFKHSCLDWNNLGLKGHGYWIYEICCYVFITCIKKKVPLLY